MARLPGAFAALRGLCSASGRGAGGDEVVLRGLSFYARHGVLPAEAELGQNFVVDLKLGCCLQVPGGFGCFLRFLEKGPGVHFWLGTPPGVMVTFPSSRRSCSSS